ncbi:MAG: SDR family NAD(P)-dependent oxidoreductase [Woeseiaceae bacterium]|nr:SDR family NAD(P)-dependent oxidoreductase [Woeseiaceae bacterium]
MADEARYPDLAGKVACITGAGRERGIGVAIARRLAREGCRVVVSDVGGGKGETLPDEAVGGSDELEALVRGIREEGGEASAMICDVLEEAEIERLVDFTRRTYGSIDVLVNNAGIGYLMSPITETATDDWDAVLGVNLRGAFIATKHAARLMIEQGSGGRIINIASQAAKSAFPHAAAYCSSKHGLVGLTRVAAIELGEHGITVNALCPNHITTGLGAWQNDYFSKKFGQTLDEYLSAMSARIPLGRPGLTRDIANACAWLCSAEAEYVTGEAMNVSGGEEMH